MKKGPHNPVAMPQRALVKGLEWVETRMSNYAAMRNFYTKILGLSVEMEEEDKEFAEFRVGKSKTFLALLDLKSGLARASGYVPTFEVSDLHQFIETMRKKGVKFTSEIAHGEHVMLIDFADPNGNTLQAFQFKPAKK